MGRPGTAGSATGFESSVKILLISPVVDVERRTELAIPQLGLYILEGLTPPEHEVRIVEEEAEAVNLDFECDLVGISCMTANAPRAYALAQEFRNRGRTVVMGGVHPTILPDEALRYADCVVIGEAEGVWEALLEDFQNRRLQRKYHNPAPDLTKYVPKNFSRMTRKRPFNVIPIMTSRGCPYSCDFCCVSDLFGKKTRHVPVENAVRDIRESGGRNFIFLDDNIIADPKYAKELFRAIKPLRIRWVGQASISLLVRDDELLQLAAESGCKDLFIGLETVDEAQLLTMRKAIAKIEHLEAALEKIKRMGILVHASVIFGFDSDTRDVFDDTVRFLKRNKVSTVSFNVLTPYPGTVTCENLKNEDRLLTTDWKYYDHSTVVFKPRGMTPFELQLGTFEAGKKFYAVTSVLWRLLGNLHSPLIYLATNYGQMKQIKVEAKRIARLRSELFREDQEPQDTGRVSLSSAAGAGDE
jgi:radical SAM superfamily enzyme YgiQ (UPF0313 family)